MIKLQAVFGDIQVMMTWLWFVTGFEGDYEETPNQL